MTKSDPLAEARDLRRAARRDRARNKYGADADHREANAKRHAAWYAANAEAARAKARAYRVANAAAISARRAAKRQQQQQTT